MERSAWPKNLSSSRKRAIQELCGQNPKKLRDAFDAQSQTGDDPRQPLFAGDLIVSVLGSFSSNTQSLSSGAESYEGFQVPSNAFVSSEVSEGSESIMSPLESVKTPVPVRRSPIESVKPPIRGSFSIKSEQSLVKAATAIYEGRVDVASEILRRLSAVPNPMRTSKQKLIGYMISALESRVSPVDYPPPVTELFTEEHVSSVRSLYDLSPSFRGGCIAANIAILEAASEQPSTNKLHVIDFDIGWERQYIDLLYALSLRQAGNQFTLKITALADSLYPEKRLRMFGDGLSDLAARSGFRLVFNIVRQKLSELSRDSLGCEPDEMLAVNLAFKLYRMPDESVSVENPRNELLRRVKGLAPRVVTLVEQEMNGNMAPFPMRVGEALAYYEALLETFDSNFFRYNSERATRAEEGLSRKLVNLVACEGRDRVERCEVFGKWRARMGMAGFKLKPLGPHVDELMKVWFGWCGSRQPSHTVKEENGGVCFSWGGRTLTVASAWR
ncbi:scarecrow-like protein 8 [Eucalyptus grandis]|uniref:scarecrow-like protein 8 n=1 Tax=Eucalyptus grandis TaxID=71139 RepID=UPI00192F0ED5|nr:scarecrow-like protein 8 [Eucalyptus grandis]